MVLRPTKDTSGNTNLLRGVTAFGRNGSGTVTKRTSFKKLAARVGRLPIFYITAQNLSAGRRLPHGC
jgi:hypothetical protein